MSGEVDGDHAVGAAAKDADGKREGEFDHAVLNLHYDLNLGEQLFKALGFKVTPRSYHTLGSMNNLIVFESNYLELIGLDPSNPNPRKELLEWPVGLNGLVFASDDVEVTAARLRSSHFPVLEPKTFSRQVTIGTATSEARFRTVSLGPKYFQASRVYFCEHQTPDLIWNDAFMSDPNSASSLERLVIVADDFNEQARSLGRVLDPSADTEALDRTRGTRIEFDSGQHLRDLYGKHVCSEAGKPRVAMITIGVTSLEAVKLVIDPHLRKKLAELDASRLVLPAWACFGVAVEFAVRDVILP